MGREADSDERIIRSGSNSGYHWLTATGDLYIGTLLKVCPEIALDRYIAVTSYDSGFRRLTQQDLAAGWTSEDQIAYSPRIASVDMLAYQRDGPDYPGYDEWYVFTEPCKLGPVFERNYFEYDADGGSILTFASTIAFVLHDPDPYLPGVLDRFWVQLRRIGPEAFIADGQDCLTVVCRSQSLLEAIGDRFAALP